MARKRSILTLLKIVVKALKHEKNMPYEKNGLCCYISGICFVGIIDYNEKQNLYNFIELHEPKKGIFYDPTYNLFYWDPNNKEIRIKWLEYHIKELTKLKKSKNI